MSISEYAARPAADAGDLLALADPLEAARPRAHTAFVRDRLVTNVDRADRLEHAFDVRVKVSSRRVERETRPDRWLGRGP